MGREGWVGEVKCDVKEREEVVGRVKGKGMVVGVLCVLCVLC